MRGLKKVTKIIQNNQETGMVNKDLTIMSRQYTGENASTLKKNTQ